MPPLRVPSGAAPLLRGRGLKRASQPLLAAVLAVARDGVLRVGEDDVVAGAARDRIRASEAGADRVVALAAHEMVVALVAAQGVVPAAAVEAVVPVVALHVVVPGAADQLVAQRAAV